MDEVWPNWRRHLSEVSLLTGFGYRPVTRRFPARALDARGAPPPRCSAGDFLREHDGQGSIFQLDRLRASRFQPRDDNIWIAHPRVKFQRPPIRELDLESA